MWAQRDPVTKSFRIESRGLAFESLCQSVIRARGWEGGGRGGYRLLMMCGIIS